MTDGAERGSRSALFGPPRPRAGPAVPGDGRQALFSAPPRRKGTVLIECSRCQGRRPVPVIDLGRHLVPSIWVPGRPFPRLMRCPTCGERSWCRVHWRTLLD